MPTNLEHGALTHIRDIVHRLQLPVPDLVTLLSLLSGPLECLGLLPPQFGQHNTAPLPHGTIDVARHIPPIQRALLEHVVSTWVITLREENAIILLEQYFCPDSFCFTSPAAGEVVLLAYSNILSLPLSEYSISLLARLTKEYPVDRLHPAVFRTSNATSKTSITWQDCVRNVAAVPAKVANATEGKANISHLLEHATYFTNVSQRCEALIFSLSINHSRDKIPSITYVLTKLVNLGVFPVTPPTSRSQPSFFMSNLPTIRARLETEDRHVYATYWSEVILSLPSTFTLQAIVASLFSSLSGLSSGIDPSPHQRTLVKREAALLREIVAPLKVENQELWDCISALILGRDWSEGHGRILTCWAAGTYTDGADQEGMCLEVLLNKVVDIWSSPEHIKHSLISRHRHLTSLLLVTVSYFPPGSAQLNALAFSPSFISGIGTYVSHLDNSVRHCGMLVAEIVAERVGKKLDFGDWEGDDAGKPWAREIRQLVAARDLDADDSIDVKTEIGNIEGRGIEETPSPSASKDTEPSRSQPIALGTGYDSDDSLTGYASPSSSRSSSPTPSELDEIAKDPTLGVGVKKIPRPVYLAQLGEMVRSTGGLKADDDNQEADKIEMALNCAEELIRKKRTYGTELEENAVNLVYGLVGLQDNFNLDNFETKRQSALNALVACCPRKAAPCLIEEFFKNQYSTNQRYVVLNALALGSRELASLSVTSSAISSTLDLTSFPSKALPPERHRQYLLAGNQDHGIIHQLLDGITLAAINRGNKASAAKVPQLVRERQLRIRKPTKIMELDQATQAVRTSPTTFNICAAEFFIMPLINRFWLFLRDEQMREERTSHHDTLHRYRGAGTGLILNPVVLAHFLGTLAILVHAATNAPEWLAVMAPDALELAVTIGTRPVSQTGLDDEDDGRTANSGGKEASVLTTSLELALVVLDGCLELDGGRALCLEHTAVLLGAGEWAGMVFRDLEKGVRVLGGGGAQEIKLRRAAAGVLLKVDDLTSRWRRSMKIKNLKGYRLSRPYYRGYSSTIFGVRFLSRPAAVTSLAAAAATVLWYSTKQVVYNDASSLRSAIGEDDQSGVLVGIVFGSNRSNLLSPETPNVDSIRTPSVARWLQNVALRDLVLHESHAACIDARGDVYQWGDSFFGPLTSAGHRKPILTLRGKNIISLQVTESRVFALSASGKVYVLAATSYKPCLRTGAPVQPSTPWWREGRFWGEDNTDSVQILPQEKLGWGEKFVSISAGQDHLLALTSAGRTFAHPITKNANAYGQLGFRKFDIPDSSSKQTRLAVELVPKFVAEPYSRASLSSQSFRSSVSDILAEIDDRNIIFCDKLFEIPVLKGLEVSQVAAGGRSSYVRTSSGKLLGWGANEHGQLGLGSNVTLNTITVPTEIVFSNTVSGRTGSRCLGVCAGGDLTCFTVERVDASLVKTVGVLCVGDGRWGGLGNNNYSSAQGTPIRAKNISGLCEYSDETHTLQPILPDSISISPTGHVLFSLDTLALSGSGGGGRDFFVWGKNHDYELGIGSRRSLPIPTALHKSDNNRLMLKKVRAKEVRDLQGKVWKRGVDVEQRGVAGYGNSIIYWRIS